VRDALADPKAFRGNRMAQLKQAAEGLRAQIEGIVGTTLADVATAIEGRKVELVASGYYAKATPAAREGVIRTVDSFIGRVGSESQIALIREHGSSFEASIYPSLLDQLAASREPVGGEDAPTPKQTVSIKTITVVGVSGVLETEDAVDGYLEALRTALLDTLNDGKRISL
ncbi:MAG: BREX system P-loop protein BrxC, partial [Cryobacterium sp.]|nr:BREX system P-loop protein BrxC [Cryobacterium sp.]